MRGPPRGPGQGLVPATEHEDRVGGCPVPPASLGAGSELRTRGRAPWQARQQRIETERQDQPGQSRFIDALNTGSWWAGPGPGQAQSSRTDGRTAGWTPPCLLRPCRSHRPCPSTHRARAQGWSQRHAWGGGRAAHSGSRARSPPVTLGHQRVEHIEHEGHQGCHGAQNKVPEAALIWGGGAAWRGAHPVLGPPGTPGRRPLGHRLLRGLQLLPNPGSLQCAEGRW